MTLQLPSHFKPTHKTAGLWGKGTPPWGHGKLDALDCFAPSLTPVACPANGRVIKLSGHKPTPVAQPGGPYGWSIYLRSSEGVYYLTHFQTRAPAVKLGAYIRRGQIIGTVARYAEATHGVTPSHIHEGYHAGYLAPVAA